MAEEQAKAAAEAQLAKESCSECRKRLPAAKSEWLTQGDGVFCSANCMRSFGRKKALAAFEARHLPSSSS